MPIKTLLIYISGVFANVTYYHSFSQPCEGVSGRDEDVTWLVHVLLWASTR